MKKLLVLLVILLGSITVQAQNMLGSTYSEVKDNYKKHYAVYKNWEQGWIDSTHVFYVIYDHIDFNYTMICYFNGTNPKDTVFKYIISDKATEAPTYKKLFTSKFIATTDHSWIDNNIGCVWDLHIEGDYMFLQAELVDKD